MNLIERANRSINSQLAAQIVDLDVEEVDLVLLGVDELVDVVPVFNRLLTRDILKLSIVHLVLP